MDADANADLRDEPDLARSRHRICCSSAAAARSPASRLRAQGAGLPAGAVSLYVIWTMLDWVKKPGAPHTLRHTLFLGGVARRTRPSALCFSLRLQSGRREGQGFQGFGVDG
ncbi:hypothetical protein DL766_002783 [Monosporascus sp. MC13-8B]|uniref:Uncharacterized protein n=1 Tax=Monosporascus cannonballus TaxID=155416 RepID=A0ABY0HIR9_9PEZI|nr:hypothetical protein DL762_000531 [Monosporascus cannonballus]RYO96042.1 hypothetical protein DL763_003434 [Monosporascus cannonballus]RYP34885.1 hypothetical protein DL766_002783 [Monosporascus sp. MC13-8B]